MTTHADISPEVRKKMARLYAKDGLSISTLRLRFGYGYERIRQVLHEEGVILRDPGGKVFYSSGVP